MNANRFCRGPEDNSHGSHIALLITTLRSNSRGSDNLCDLCRHLHNTHAQHTSTYMDTDVDTDIRTLLGIKFPVAGFLHCQYNKPNQTELKSPDLMNRAVQSKALIPVTLRKARNRIGEHTWQIYGPSLKQPVCVVPGISWGGDSNG